MLANPTTYQQEVRQSIRDNAALSGAYLLMNALATIVASYGLLANSTAVVIGAMVIAMLLGPITGIALALVDGDPRLLRKAWLAELSGVAVVLILSFLIGALSREIPLGKEIMARTSPNILDLIIALAGGAAGAYATTSPRINGGLIGVAIATALVPPLASGGILLARGEIQLAFGGLLLFFANFVAIQISSSLVLWLRGYHQLTYRVAGRSNLLAGNLVSLGLLIVLAVALGLNFTQSLARQNLETEVRAAVKAELTRWPDAQLVELTFTEAGAGLDLDITARTSRQPTYQEVVALQTAIAARLQRPTALKLIVVPTTKLDPLAPPPPTPTVTPGPSPTPTATPTATLTPIPSPSVTASATVTPTPTETATPAPTQTATPTATFTPTPLPAFVANTAGLGLVLRDAPDGRKIGTLPEGTPLQLLYRREVVAGVEWQEVRDLLGRVGWVAAQFLHIES